MKHPSLGRFAVVGMEASTDCVRTRSIWSGLLVGLGLFGFTGCDGSSSRELTDDPPVGALPPAMVSAPVSPPAAPADSGTAGTEGAPATPVTMPPPVDAEPPAPMPCLSSDAAEAYRNLPYVSAGHERQVLDLFVPEGAGPFPVLIWIHGGGWGKGDKSSCPVTDFTEYGYAVVSVNYRLSSMALFPAQIQDVKAAIRWLRSHANDYRLDAERLAVSGDSAGGHLASLSATSGAVSEFDDPTLGNPQSSSAVQAAAPFYGPSDFLQMDAQARANDCASPLVHDAPNSPESRLLGCLISTWTERVASANPITYIDASDPPFLIQHGTNDCLVPPGQGQILHESLEAAGVSSQLRLIDGAGHGGAPFTRQVLLQFL